MRLIAEPKSYSTSVHKQDQPTLDAQESANLSPNARAVPLPITETAPIEVANYVIAIRVPASNVPEFFTWQAACQKVAAATNGAGLENTGERPTTRSFDQSRFRARVACRKRPMVEHGRQ